jgi:hypothetical protein
MPNVEGMIIVGGGVCTGMIMQVYRDLAGCDINCTSHVEGWHLTLKVHFLHIRLSRACENPQVKTAWNLTQAKTTIFQMDSQSVMCKIT